MSNLEVSGGASEEEVAAVLLALVARARRDDVPVPPVSSRRDNSEWQTRPSRRGI